MWRLIHDLVVDTLDEDVLEDALRVLGKGRLVRDKKEPDEPWLTEDGYVVVRLKDVEDPQLFAREIQRRVWGLRVVGLYER